MLRKKRIKKNLRKTPLKIRKLRRKIQLIKIYFNSPVLKEYFEESFRDSLCGFNSSKPPSFMDIMKPICYQLSKLEYEKACLIAKQDEQKSKNNNN